VAWYGGTVKEHLFSELILQRWGIGGFPGITLFSGFSKAVFP
jgi:hypothetical protein